MMAKDEEEGILSFRPGWHKVRNSVRFLGLF